MTIISRLKLDKRIEGNMTNRSSNCSFNVED